jgi:NADPH:quinone reductase-like Zn-dependent oxidoreductase
MKAVQATVYGSSDVLKVTDIAEPVPKEGQVLVDVHAAGLNPFDLMILSGAYKERIPLTFPLTFGGDFAGTRRDTGEEVYGTAIVLSGGSGSYAEAAVISPQKLAAKPKNVSFPEAAALPVAGMTAVEAIADHMKLTKGQKILIHGGAGGVGHYAIQYAKSLGAYVITTASADDAEFVKSLGADESIDYTTQAFETVVSGVDGVLDTIGKDVTTKSYQVIKPGGTLVTLVNQADSALKQRYQVNVTEQNTKTDAPQLARLAGLVERGVIKPHIDKVFQLAQTAEAVAHLSHGHPRGKVVVQVTQ